MPLTLGNPSSELFTDSKTSRITLIKKKVRLNPTDARVLECFFHAIQQYCGFNISLANRKESKNAITNCTFESKNSNSVRSPGKWSAPKPSTLPRTREQKPLLAQSPKQVGGQDQSQMSCLWSRTPPPKLLETIHFLLHRDRINPKLPMGALYSKSISMSKEVSRTKSDDQMIY